MTRAERIVLTLMTMSAVALGLVIGVGMGDSQVVHATSGTFYGANTSNMALAAGTGRMPEGKGNWCGISNISVIEAYDSNESGAIMSQQSVYDLLANQNPTYNAVSPWGTANPVVVDGVQDYPYLTADIAADGGTDPRSIAWGLYTVTPAGYYYHNYIYPGSNGADHATRNFALDFGSKGFNHPISVTINGGRHSVVISGVFASGDPSVNPNGVTLYGVMVWDPWYDYITNPNDPAYHYYNTTGVNQVWDLSSWEGNSRFWGQTYDTGSRGNNSDPDPSTPTNYYNAPPAHWGGNYITIEEDNVGSQASSIALDNLGNPVYHH